MLRPADDLATKADIETTRHELGQQIGALRSDVTHEIGALRSDVTREFAAVRHELVEMESRLTLTTERLVHEAFATQTRTLVLGLVGAFLLTASTNVLTIALR